MILRDFRRAVALRGSWFREAVPSFFSEFCLSITELKSRQWYVVWFDSIKIKSNLIPFYSTLSLQTSFGSSFDVMEMFHKLKWCLSFLFHLTEFYWVLLGFTGFYWTWLSFLLFLGLAKFDQTLPSCFRLPVFYWVSPIFSFNSIKFFKISLDFIGLSYFSLLVLCCLLFVTCFT